MRDYINACIKHREWFRPVAPAVVEEAASQYFVTNKSSPFMLVTTLVRPESRDAIPAVVHIDKTARLQTVRKSHNPRFHRLLSTFGELTSIPMLINTSFNTKDEPIVETPKEAVESFLGMRLDALVLDRFFLVKSEQLRLW